MKNNKMLFCSHCSKICFFLGFSFLLSACTDGKETVYRYAGGEIRLETAGDSLSILLHIPRGSDANPSEFQLPYPTFRLSCGDLTGDGIPEIGVGVIKRTRFSPEPDKRLFLFHLTDGNLIRPLWMGSHVGGRLDDFYISDALIHTDEHNAADSTFHRTYKLTSFGIKPVAL